MRIEGCLEKGVDLLSPITIDKKQFSHIVIREAVGSDCEVVSVARLKETPTNVMVEVVRSIIAEIPGASRMPTTDEIKSLPVVTLENIIQELSILSAGDEYEAEFKCPNERSDGSKCGHVFKENILKSDLLDKKKVQLVNTCTLKRGITKDGKVLKVVRFKPLDSNAQENMLKDRSAGKFAQINSQLMADCIIDVDGVSVGLEDVQRMSTIDRKELTTIIQKSVVEAKTILKRTCPECGGEVAHYVNILDFLV